MNVLGSFSQMYMFILLALLFLGSGFAIWKLISNIMEWSSTKPLKVPSKVQNEQVNIIKNNLKGGLFMNNNGWLKLAVFSFLGILVSVVILGFVSTGNSQGSMSIHQQHQLQQQQGMQGMSSGMNMGNIGMQQSGMNGQMGMQNDNMMMQQQLNQMQQQLNQMQQQMGMMNGQNMGGMSNMPQNNGSMNNMPQNNSSGGGMSGMGMM